MEYVKLGRTDIKVSRICLGTMTFGEQNTEAEAHDQLSYAFDRGITFLDTAEMYPVPPRPETQGRTEAYIGSWLKATGLRDRVVIATKVAGPSRGFGHPRGDKGRLDRPNIRAAIEGSLRRLGTDYVDLYQLHWPDRLTAMFGQSLYKHEIDPEEVPIEETLEALQEIVREGKVRAIGLSNETPWGAMRFFDIAERRGLPRAASIQNAYSLVNRTFEYGLSEIAHREGIGLLAYSPLGGGTLSGKYLGGDRPAGARMTIFTRFNYRYENPQGLRATARYVTLARDHGFDPAQLALAYVYRKPFVTSTIIGATTRAQLRSDIDAFDLEPPRAIFYGIEAIHTESPNPCP
jgi:aryl-alcohol dehydrogenase-like predicted oxidoreductase